MTLLIAAIFISILGYLAYLGARRPKDRLLPAHIDDLKYRLTENNFFRHRSSKLRNRKESLQASPLEKPAGELFRRQQKSGRSLSARYARLTRQRRIERWTQGAGSRSELNF